LLVKILLVDILEFDILLVNILLVDISTVNILLVDILLVDILLVNILLVDILLVDISEFDILTKRHTYADYVAGESMFFEDFEDDKKSFLRRRRSEMAERRVTLSPGTN
jgi:hypothetical protein